MSAGTILSVLAEDYEQYRDNSTNGSLESNIKKGGTGGSFGNISFEDYKHLLLFNDDLSNFHQLPFRVLLHLPSLMTRLGTIQITHDHYHFWAWTAEAFKEINRNETYLERDIEQMFLLVVDYAVGGLTSVPVSERLWEENNQIQQLVSPHAYRAMLHSYRAATQLSHPLLEGLLRRLCSDYVGLDGKIDSGKCILKMSGNEQTGGRVSNVGNLLYHYEKRVADEEVASSLKSIRSEMENYSNSTTGYSIINSWRHPHSHGGERLSGAEHIVLLNIICQLIWATIPEQSYEGIDKEKYSRKILNHNQNPRRNHFEYYPLRETRELLVERDWQT